MDENDIPQNTQEEYSNEGLYIPESFTEEEEIILKQFFTNTDRKVFCIINLPEEVIGALSSLYSRSTKSMRRLFLDYFVSPILDFDESTLSEDEVSSYREVRERFKRVIDAMASGDNIESISNTERGRVFYETWYNKFGDDSIAEQVGIHMGFEDVSNMVTDAIKALNLPHISKSSRYVSWSEKDEAGNYKFVIPEEIKGTEFEERYTAIMSEIFSLYAELEVSYFEYIKEKYPKGDDETEKSFSTSRKARTFDDLRDLLPFATKTNFGTFGNARTYKLLIDQMMASPFKEVRDIAQMMYEEISKVTPSLISGVKTERGRALQSYIRNFREWTRSLSIKREGREEQSQDKLVQLISVFPETDAIEEIIAQLIFSESVGVTYGEIFEFVKSRYTEDQKKDFFKQILAIRTDGTDKKRESVRRRELPLAFEHVRLVFDCILKGGDCRDIWRHRFIRFSHQPFTTLNGFSLEKDLEEFKDYDKIKAIFSKIDLLYKEMSSQNIESSQYVVPFGFLQRFLMEGSIRQLFWMIELRSGPQGRIHYRNFVLQLAQIIENRFPELSPLLFQDRSQYPISRREEAKKK